MGDKKRIAVIFGGQSSEHEVSRMSAESVIKNIDKEKYEVEMLGITKDGRWLSYDGPVELLGTGEWQILAEAKAKRMPRDKSTDLSDNNIVTLAGTPVRGILKAAGTEKENKKVDVLFTVLHGCNGEDGTIQGLFELAGIPYVGSGVLGSALGMDKGYAKIVFEKEGIPQGRYIVFTRRQISQATAKIVEQVEEMLTYPCFVKPSNMCFMVVG